METPTQKYHEKPTSNQMGSSLHRPVTTSQWFLEKFRQKRKQIGKKYKKIENKENGTTFNIDPSSDTNKYAPHNPVNKEIWKTRKGLDNFYLQLPVLFLHNTVQQKKLQTCFQVIENTTRFKREK